MLCCCYFFKITFSCSSSVVHSGFTTTTFTTTFMMYYFILTSVCFSSVVVCRFTTLPRAVRLTLSSHRCVLSPALLSICACIFELFFWCHLWLSSCNFYCLPCLVVLSPSASSSETSSLVSDSSRTGTSSVLCF